MTKSKPLFNLRSCVIYLIILTFAACEDTPSIPEPLFSVPAAVPDETTDVSSDITHYVEAPLRAAANTDSLIGPRDLGYFTPLTEECCTQPGAASECWMNDAEQDGVLCDGDSDCPKGCNVTKGRCECESSDDCRDGICVDGICGPSWCNGYLICSCWGGCDWWATDENQTLHDLAGSQGKYCCEGVYAADPVDVDPALGGSFSDTPCGACAIDADCDDGNPCTSDACVEDACVITNLNGTQDTVPAAADCIFDGSSYAADCARTMCVDGACAVEKDWKTGEVCTGSPATVPAGADDDCYTRTCASDGTCSVNISAGASCNVGENPCANATCDASAACQDAPLDAAGLAANPDCCDPDVAASFDDGHSCTDDYCCHAGEAAASCDDVPAYSVRNVPNYDPANPGDCCLDSYNCSDGNDCTQNICCGTANAGLDDCGGDADDPSWECVSLIRDVPGCCNDAPASLADNCADIFDCTDNSCCTPAAIAAAADGDPCFEQPEYNCASALAYAAPPAGCCDPDQSADTFCDDGNICTAKYCDSLSHQCESEPQPLIDGCCGPNPGDACGDADGNACTEETCCDPLTIAGAASGDPCFGKTEWSCAVSVSTLPGCCVSDDECDDGNPCTADSCVANTCTWGALDDLSAVAGLCCTVGGDNDSQCADGNDPGDCTQNLCCSASMVASALPGDACYGKASWACIHPVEAPLPSGCCTASTYGTDCNPDANPCVVEDCVNSNCTWTPSDVFPDCCDADGDCPAADASRPCLASSSCDLADDPLTNINYAHCDLSFEPAGTSCGTGGDCFDDICGNPADENFNCTEVSYVPAGTQTCSPPNAPPCGQYWCDGSGGCSTLETTSNTHDNDTCGVSTLGSGAAITVTDETNACTPDDYEPDDGGIFSECTGETYSDIVFGYEDVVADDYQLIHRVVTVEDVDGDWDPIIYTRTDCATASTQTACNNNCTFDGSNYSTDVYGPGLLGACQGSESTVIPTPVAVTDVPSHNATSPVAVSAQDFDQNNIRDGYDVERTHATSVIVDSRYSLPDNGGAFDMTITDETHNNNDCRNIGAYSASPVIDGSFQWKQRWRGNTAINEYTNYFGAGGPRMGMSTASTATDPHQAFFKLEIPSGSGEYLTYVDWNAMEKRGEDGHIIAMDDATNAAGYFHATLSKVWADSGSSSECTSDALETAYFSSGHPPQLQLAATDTTYENAWLAVGNRTAAEYGDYELSVVKLQPDFFGFTNGYSEEGSGRGCGTLGYFDAEGQRLDFIPKGDTDYGYVMTISDVQEGPDDCPGETGGTDNMWDRGWLIHPRCYGSSGNGEALSHTRYTSDFGEIKALPFKFPFGNDTYSFAYVDSSGRISLLKAVDDSVTCNSDGDCSAVGDCATAPRGCTCTKSLSEKTCVYDPGSIDVEPDVEKFFAPASEGGYAPLIAGAWGSFKTRWANGTKGYVTTQSVVFEGTTAFAVSWVGMEIDDNAPKATNLPNNSTWNHYHMRPGWQVILRIDGRIVFYYRPDGSGSVHTWDETVDRGTFVVGIGGGTSTITCADDGDCQTAYGADVQCDDSGPSGYNETYRCYRLVQPFVEGSNGLGNE